MVIKQERDGVEASEVTEVGEIIEVGKVVKVGTSKAQERVSEEYAKQDGPSLHLIAIWNLWVTLRELSRLSKRLGLSKKLALGKVIKKRTFPGGSRE